MFQQCMPKREIWGDGKSAFWLGNSGDLLPRIPGQSQLIYLDPPFMSGGHYCFTQKVGQEGWQGDKNYQIARPTYGDRWRGGIEAYQEMLMPILEAGRDRLTDTGAMALHVDWRVSAHVRLMLDELFGEDHFENEIIWAYQSGGMSKKHFARKHDSIFIYRKGKTMAYYPNAVGQKRGAQRRNHLKRTVDEDGRVYFSVRSGGREYRYYEDDWVTPGDVWSDIPILQQKDPERTGYETQKPRALLDRLILALTVPGDQVCDPFSGSGTTAASAAALGRRALAIDREPAAAHLFRRRLWEANAGFVMENLAQADLTGRPLFCLDENQIRLAGWDGPQPMEPKPSLLKDEGLMLDAWATGYLQGDTFVGKNHDCRTASAPALKQNLPVSENNPAVFAMDVYGGDSYWNIVP